jgi:hypothetical protein
MSGIKIVNKGVLGIQIDVPFVTDLGSDRNVNVTVSDFGINVAATGELNADGVQALKQAVNIAEAVQSRGFAG